ncbi:MmgE/PrpD family protein [Tsukamurella sp. NPDC003166]|uniref:MmgE/PrpD family protein n=1 Tax=Tsukamurella sp. NPDC003166 TaxID=3154444 RepID=UPI0033A5411B
MTSTITARVAAHVAAVAARDLDDLDVEALRRLLLDNLIVTLWGATRPVTRDIAAWTERFAGSGTSAVLGRSWTTEASIAALVHGTAAHGYELDDTHNGTASHPGAPLVATALAVAAEPGPTVRPAHFLQALAAGYEAMTLLGEASGGMSAVHRGFHPTALYGAFGAAVTTLALRALRRDRSVDPDAVVTAWGHALSMPSGSMQFSVEPTGGEIKRVHAGLGAHNGIRAADFSALPGVTAPRAAIEGTYGVAASFAGPLREPNLGRGLRIHELALKPYSCCRLFHSTIDALREATAGFTLPVEQIADIEIAGPRLVEEQHMGRAESPMAAQYSCPYIVGATLAYGPSRYDAYGEAFLADRAITSIADRVRFRLDPELEKRYYPDHFASAVRLTTVDGAVRTAMVVDSLGTAEHPLSVDDIGDKADGLAAFGLQGVADRLRAVIFSDAGPSALAEALHREASAVVTR